MDLLYAGSLAHLGLLSQLHVGVHLDHEELVLKEFRSDETKTFLFLGFETFRFGIGSIVSRAIHAVYSKIVFVVKSTEIKHI